MPSVDDEQTSTPRAPMPTTVVDDPGIAVGAADGPSLTGPAAELSDVELEQEIELVSILVLAASASSRPLTLPEIDRCLGL